MRISLLEKDCQQLINNPNFNIENDLRVQEAFLANEIEHLERVRARQHQDLFRARLSNHGEKLGGIWSASAKVSKPRNLIYHLKVPNTNPPQYERNSNHMAELTHNYHSNMQYDNLSHFHNQKEFDHKLHIIIDAIPNSQLLPEPITTTMNWTATQAQIAKVIDIGKNNTATGLDGCPYELWKALKSCHESLSAQPNTKSFNIVKALTEIIVDIQTHNLDPNTNFTLAWMCPTFKKKDPTEISNYHPISILNTDYKILTKVMALQLNEYIHSLIHSDQAGFIPKRVIFNHIHLSKAIINYTKITEEDGAIITLNQEKAYDKIRHDYLWRILEAFHLPPLFIKTIKALYEHAHTCVAINGVLSSPFQVT